MHKKRLILLALATVLILLLPLITMQFTDEVIWNLADFIVAGILIFGFGLTYQLISSEMKLVTYKVAVGLAVATSLILIWMNLAVGIIGNEENPANLMFFGVLAVGMIGTFIARLKPYGMALTLFAMAFAQILIAIFTLIAGLGFTLIINGLFASLWCGSALLFLIANQQQAIEH
ncbi:hypothetical protein N8303_06250 [Gammaproteobacteria bacterium]|nr:hypothetical protein [Gammaproteobacteria bacterium]